VLSAAPVLAGLVEDGDAMKTQNRHREALALYQEAGRRTPGSAEILRRVAGQYEILSREASGREKKELAERALTAARQAVDANPADSPSRLSVAVACGRLAQLESPRRQMELSRLIKAEAEEAVRLDAGNDLAWHVLARWNFEMASVNGLARTLAQVIYGKFPEASAARAEECFQRAIAAGPPRVMHHVEYGLMLEKLDRKIDARKQLEIGLSLPAKDQEDEETQQRARQALDRLR
jgi:tetratricopeptide (TPR) repeat protein